MTERQLLMSAALLEVAVFIMLFNKNINKNQKLNLIIWLSSIFLIYRIGLLSINYEGSCNCLGYLYKWLSITEQTVNIVSKIIVMYMMAGALCIKYVNYRIHSIK